LQVRLHQERVDVVKNVHCKPLKLDVEGRA
jgi:hypothetical protein